MRSGFSSIRQPSALDKIPAGKGRRLLTFAPGVLYEVSQALYSAPCRAPGLIDYQGGHFRNLLWSLQTSRGNPDPRIDLSPELVLISDEWTMDFDVPEHLNEIPRLERYLSSSVPGQGT